MIKLFSTNRVFVFVVCMMLSSAVSGQSGLKLWYDRPAADQSTGFPLGNGLTGALVSGNPVRESIQLNEATVWGSRTSGYQPVGDLIIQFPSHKKTSGYTRELNIAEAVAVTRYNYGGIVFTREYLTSWTDSVLLVRLRASKPKSITCDISLSTSAARARFSDDGLGMLMLNATAGNPSQSDGVRFAVRVRPLAKNGRCMVRNNVFSVQGADEVVICLSMASNVDFCNNLTVNETERATRILASAYGKDYEVLKSRHVQAYQAQFNRVSLDLGTTSRAVKATDVRAKEILNTTDPAYASLLFQYGRYLLLSSSQPGAQPASLNGLWKSSLQPESRYSLNLPALIGYWSSETTRMPETQEPLFRMIKELSVTGQQIAREKYGMRGWCAGLSTDLWRSGRTQEDAVSDTWPLGSAWLCRLLWEHYLYTGDKVFLLKYYPVMAGAARFYADWMLRVSSGKTPQSLSQVSVSMSKPEGGNALNPSFGDDPDQALVNDLFALVIRSTEILNGGIKSLFGNESTAFSDTLKKLLPQLKPLPVGLKNTAGVSVADLYVLFPASYVSPYRTPELFSRSKRLFSESGLVTDNSLLNWQLSVAARLADAQLAYQILQKQLSLSDRFSAPGLSAGIAEMLIQSHDGFVNILPALPAVWKNGSVRGLAVRGGFTFDIRWKEGRVDQLTVHSALGGNLRLRSLSALTARGLKMAKGENSNALYCVEKSFCRMDPNGANSFPVTVPESFLYDLKTEPGQVVEFLPLIH